MVLRLLSVFIGFWIKEALSYQHTSGDSTFDEWNLFILPTLDKMRMFHSSSVVTSDISAVLHHTKGMQVFLWHPYSCITLTTTSTRDHKHTETHIDTKTQLNKYNDRKKEKDGVWERTCRLTTTALLEDIGVVISIPKTTPNPF